MNLGEVRQTTDFLYLQPQIDFEDFPIEFKVRNISDLKYFNYRNDLRQDKKKLMLITI
jgi:hypothetical protein